MSMEQIETVRYSFCLLFAQLIKNRAASLNFLQFEGKFSLNDWLILRLGLTASWKESIL